MATKVIDIIVERRGYVLLIKRGDFWIFPGGELQEGETELECIEKVVAKEMNDKISNIFERLENTITGKSVVRADDVEVVIYTGDISARKMTDVTDCNAFWFTKESIATLRLSNIAKGVFDYYMSLKTNNSGGASVRSDRKSNAGAEV